MKSNISKFCRSCIVIFSIGLLFSQQSLSQVTVLNVKKLTIDDVRLSGKLLISQPVGFTKIVNEKADSSDVLVIAVHGYKSEGYEWVGPLNKLAQRYNNTYFYRYEWEICPEQSSDELAEQIELLINSLQGIRRVVIFGHSYGGLVVTYLASELQVSLNVEIHTIASPLAGYPGILEKCEIRQDHNNQILYPLWETYIQHYQWRTVHKQDNAFNKLSYDPQIISITKSKSIRLPETMDGHRLGHNWSITWVIDEYLGIQHSP